MNFEIAKFVILTFHGGGIFGNKEVNSLFIRGEVLLVVPLDNSWVLYDRVYGRTRKLRLSRRNITKKLKKVRDKILGK